MSHIVVPDPGIERDRFVIWLRLQRDKLLGGPLTPGTIAEAQGYVDKLTTRLAATFSPPLLHYNEARIVALANYTLLRNERQAFVDEAGAILQELGG